MTTYILQTDTANPFNGINVGSLSAPTLADLDGDGDLDAVVGELSGTLLYYRNTGTATNPVYLQQPETANPFNGINVGNYITPTLADLDGDKDLDAVVGYSGGTLLYYRNTGTATNPVYLQQTDTANPFNGINVGSFSAPTFADLDGDKDLDAVVGYSGGTLLYYRNTGTATNPVYVQQTDTANPFNGIDVGSFSAPTLADLDGDKDLDAVVGADDGTLLYYRNTGTATNPVYVQQTDTANPFNGIDVGSFSAPTFADLDGDRDLDAVVGADDGTLSYLLNTDTTPKPIYVQQTDTANPFNGIDVGSFSAPTFADLDGDKDLDAVVGGVDGTLLYYRNTGTATNPVYVQQTSTANPFNGIDVGSYMKPTFADLDGDKDLDAVVGASDGTLLY
ncbi:FG-GAP repeat domain-containing protein [Sphaerospermopsis aphanizomenoides]|nr:VCBS repeat-containing protein [Sphaerospermopsis aphanizomenoides]